MITSIIISFLIFIAALCNAVMDTVDHHFSNSIFNKIKSPFWRLWFNENAGWKNKYVDRDPSKGRVKWNIFGIKFNKPVQITDAWHFFKKIMIFAICLIPSILLVHLEIYLYEFETFNTVLNILLYWLLFGTIWNVTFFRIFYNGLLKND